MSFGVSLCLILGLTLVTSDDLPSIKTPNGIVQGYYKTSYQGRTYSAFEGIPYAKPPIDDLRFREPQPADKWDDVLIANQSYACMCFLPIPGLFGIHGTEDCLYLYVYVPLEKITGDENLDVIVHIHGGAFMLGAPSLMAGPNYIMDKDVVFVSLNYRLAILGFLSTEDNVVSGNNGLKDQVMALRWVQENIRYFGGNPNSVTINGISAGGASVHLHYLSPLSRGLFHRGMSHSGTALHSWAIVEKPLSKATVVAEGLNCTTETTEKMVDCLRQVPAAKLLNGMTKLFLYLDSIPLIIFGPVIEKGENRFLEDHPYRLMKEGHIYDVPWITSNVKNEGLFPTAFFVMLHKMQIFEDKWEEILPYLLDIYDTVNKSAQIDVVNKVRKQYFDNNEVSEENAYFMVNMLNDRFYFIDTEKSLRLQSQMNKSPVYFYFFTYLLANPAIPTFGIKRGVGHGDDGSLFLKVFGAPIKLNPQDEKMMKMFIDFLAIYAKTGVPTFNSVVWDPVKPENELINGLEIASPDDVKMAEMKLGEKEFWNSLPIYENEKLYL